MAKKPTLVAPDMLAFVRPMAKEVWASIIIAIFGVTLIFYIVSKLSSNKAVREKAPERQNISLCASLSYSLGVLLYQVSGVYPHSMSSRIVSFVWWLFVFITITSYLANLTANSVTTTMKFTLFNVLGKYESLSDAFVYCEFITIQSKCLIASSDRRSDDCSHQFSGGFGQTECLGIRNSQRLVDTKLFQSEAHTKLSLSSYCLPVQTEVTDRSLSDNVAEDAVYEQCFGRLV